MKVAIIGTVGIPANYGGFETLVEQLVRHNHSEELQYSIYCSSKSYIDERWVYHGARIEYINLKANGIQSIPYDVISLIRASRKSDVVLVLGVSGCVFLPVFRLFSKRRLIINIDGLEHRRDKWNKWIRKLLKYSEKQAVKYADVIVTDNKGITDYVAEEYHRDSKLIAYGGDHVLSDIPMKSQIEILSRYGLKPDSYFLAICRIEPENNVHLILDSFANRGDLNLVFIGNWGKNEYGRLLHKDYHGRKNIVLLDAIYDIEQLYAIRNNCTAYIHGHSAGGTNPSLVEAMFFGKPIIAYECVYNRETTENKAIYFDSSEDLKSKLACISQNDGNKMKEIALRRYTWNSVATEYEKLYTYCSSHIKEILDT